MQFKHEFWITFPLQTHSITSLKHLLNAFSQNLKCQLSQKKKNVDVDGNIMSLIEQKKNCQLIDIYEKL